MNKRNLALLISKHPLLRKLTEDKTIPNSVVARLIVEELAEQIIDPKETDNIEKLEDVVTLARESLEEIDKISKAQIKPDDLDSLLPDIVGFIDILEEAPLPKPTEWPAKKQKITLVANQKNYNRASFEILGVLQKWVGTEQQPGAIRNISAEIQKLRQDTRPESQNQIPDLWKALQDYLKVYIDIIKFSAKIIKLSKGPGEHPCILLLRKIIKQTEQDTGKNQKKVAEESQAFIKIAQFNTDIPGNVKNKISIAHKAYAESLQSNPDIEKFVQLAQNDEECNKAFIKLKTENKELFVIGTFLINYEDFLRRIGRPTEEKPDKMLDAMKRTNKLATEQKDIYWSLDGGFTQVFEVAYLPPGSETANNGTQEKPLTDYNISQENLKTGKKGSILIVRSEQLYKVEKIVQEQEEGKRMTVSIPIDNVKQYNALFSGTENEEGMPTGSGAFFVHSDQEKMVPLKAKEPEPEEEEGTTAEPEKIDLEESAIKNYLNAFELFKTKFLNVKKLQTQSEIFRQFYMTIFPIAGIPMDTIVGQQMDAYTQTAAGADMKITDAETDIENLQEEENEDKKNLTKNISQNAKVIERHANAILEILEGYEKYLNIGGTGKGVEQGSRILFDKFGESDPKKLIRKFVKLIIKDINAAIKSSKEMIKVSEKQLEPRDDKKSKEEPEQLTEAEVDNSVRELPTREKIIMVIKTGKQVNQIGEKLKEMIARTSTSDEDKAEKEAKEGEQTGPAAKRDDLLEAPTVASDARINPDDTGIDSGPRDLRKLKARGSDEISLGYKEEAKKIHELLTKIRPLFPTSQPFDTNYSFDVAMKAFKSALTGLSTNVAQVSGYEYDQLTDAPVLASFIKKIEGFKEVIKDIFGYTKEAQEAENQASFNEEGENSDLPHPEPTKPTESGEGNDKDPKDIPEEDKEILAKLFNDEKEYFERIKKRASELSAGESAQDFGFVPEPLSEVLKTTKQLVNDLELYKTLISQKEKDYDKKQRSAGTQQIKQAKEKLQKAIGDYISLYEKIGKALQYRDFSSVLDEPKTRIERINKLIKETEEFLEKHKTTKEFFLGLTLEEGKDVKDSAYLKGIWKRMKKLSGQMPAIVDSDMKYKIKRAKLNVKKTFQNVFPKSNYNFSSFKIFVGKVADQISAMSLRIGDTLKEEDQSSETKAQQKEFDMYNKQVTEVFDLMKKFLANYEALELAMEHIKNKDVGRTKFLEAFDKEFAIFKNLIRISNMYLKKISTNFNNGNPNITVAEIYGFPPQKTTSKPDPQEADFDSALEKVNAALKKTFKLEKLQQNSGMSDSQINLYSRFLVELDKLKVVKLTESEIDDDAFKSDIKNAIEKKFDGEEKEELLQIINMKGVMNHLYKIYNREAVEVEGDPDDEETEDEEKPIVINKDNVKLKLPPPPKEVVEKAQRRKKYTDLLNTLQDTIEFAVGTPKVDAKENIKKVVTDLDVGVGFSEQDKKEIKKYLNDMVGKVKLEELPSKEELEKTLETFIDVDKDIKRFEGIYKPAENDIKFEGDIKTFGTAVIKFFKKDIESQKVEENIGDLKREIKPDLHNSLDKAIDSATKVYGNMKFQKFSGFLGQTSVEKIPGGTSTPESPKKVTQKSERSQNNATKAFAEVLEMISRTNKASGNLEEQLANKLKPLIKEMLTKGK